MYKISESHMSTTDYICDSESDKSEIKNLVFGDTVYVVETASLYMCNSQLEWVKQ